MQKLSLFGALLALLIATGCSTTRVVRPLAAKQAQVGVSIGGPVVYFKAGEGGRDELLVPFASFSGAYGINDRLSVYGGWDATPILFRVLHLDLGATYGLVTPTTEKGFGLSGGGGMQVMGSLLSGTVKVMPELTLNTYQALNDKWYWYATSGNAFDFGASRSSALNTGFWRPSLGVGVGLEGARLHQQLEVKWIGFNEGNRDAIIGHLGIGGMGQWAFYYSINLKTLGK